MSVNGDIRCFFGVFEFPIEISETYLRSHLGCIRCGVTIELNEMEHSSCWFY